MKSRSEWIAMSVSRDLTEASRFTRPRRSAQRDHALAAWQKFQDDAFAGTKLQYGVDRLAVAVEFG
jgi:hypothetical protein